MKGFGAQRRLNSRTVCQAHRRTFRAGWIMVAIGGLVFIPGCVSREGNGLFWTIPERGDIHVNGEVVDENGQRLTGVEMDTFREDPPLLYPPSTLVFLVEGPPDWSDVPSSKNDRPPQPDRFKRETRTVDGLFEVKASGWGRFDLNLSKEGYEDWKFIVSVSYPRTVDQQVKDLVRVDPHVDFSTSHPDGLRFTMVRKRPDSGLIHRKFEFFQSAGGLIHVLDVTTVEQHNVRMKTSTLPDDQATQQLPANRLWLTGNLDTATGCFATTSYPFFIFDRAGEHVGNTLRILSKCKLHLTGSGTGFILHEPLKPDGYQPRSDEMQEAPADGYRNELEIPDDLAIRCQISHGFSTEAVGRGITFFFRTANSLYGKGQLKESISDPSPKEAHITVDLWIQPNGSRELRGWKVGY